MAIGVDEGAGGGGGGAGPGGGCGGPGGAVSGSGGGGFDGQEKGADKQTDLPHPSATTAFSAERNGVAILNKKGSNSQIGMAKLVAGTSTIRASDLRLSSKSASLSLADRAESPSTRTAFSGESPYSSNGVVILSKNGSNSQIEKEEPVPSTSTLRALDLRLTSKSASLSLEDRGKGLVPEVQRIKRLKTDGSPSLLSPEISEQNNYSTSFYDEKTQASGTATPPPDWVKSHSRICMSIKQRNPIKPLTFAATSRQTQHSQDNLRHSLDQKILEKKNKKSKWDDLNTEICQTRKSTPSEQRCHSHSNCADHSIFVCHCERNKYHKNPTDFAEGSIATSIVIPGSTAETELMTPQSCKIIDGIVKTITRSHKRQICFYGMFSMKNFCCDDAGEVKLDGVEPRSLTNPGLKEDKKRAAELIKREFFRDRLVPAGIESLLSLLDSEDTRNGEVIEHQASLQPPLKRPSLYEVMYRNLLTVKRSDPKKYRAVTDDFKARVDVRRWKGSVKLNTHLEEILNHKNPATGLPRHYDETPEGLLEYIYNAVKHLTDNNYQQGALLFYDHEVDHIVFGTFAGVLESLQAAMAANGCLFKID